MRTKTFFQIANRTDAEVKSQFIVRQNEFDIVMSEIRRDNMMSSIQHYIFVGQRGSGKSTLLRRIQAEINTEVSLSDHLVAVNLSEEQAGIYRLHDLWYKVNEALGQKGFEVESVNWQQYEKDLSGYARHLYQAMQTALAKKGKKLVLLLDNIDRILDHIKGDDNHLFRELLMNHKDVRIVGGSTRLSEHYWSYKQPFYQFFRVIRLAPITQNELKELLTFWARFFGEPKLNEFIVKYPGKLNAVRILSDGMPRTMLNLVELLINKPEDHGYEYMLEIIDKATPIYQERLAALSDQQQKVLLELSFYWDAVDLAHLSETARMDSKLLSAVLKKLVELKLVEKRKDKGKDYYYLLIERFFNLWLIMTQGGPREKRKVKWLTAFLETWYDGDELKQAYRHFADDLSTGCIDADHAVIRAKGFVHSRLLSVADRDQLIERIEQMAADKKEYTDLLPAKAKDTYQRAGDLIENKEYDIAITALEEIEQDDAEKDFLLALAFYYKRDYPQAEKNYLQAIDKGETNALNNLANVYTEEGRIAEAEKYYLIAIDKGVVEASYNLANIYGRLNRIEESEKYYLLAIEKGNISALNNLANLYKEIGRIEESERYYLQAIHKGDVNAVFNLANLYRMLGRIEESETYYLQAIDKGFVEAFYNLANIYKETDRNTEAKKYYLLAIDKGHVKAMNNLANLYMILGCIEESEKYYLQAIDKGVLEALNNLANLYKEIGRIEEAEKYYLLAIEKGNNDALFNLAYLYMKLGRMEESEKYYLQAIDKGFVNALFNLANLYMESGRMEEAEKYYLLSIEKGNNDALFNLAILLYMQNAKSSNVISYIDKLKASNLFSEKESLFEKIISTWSGVPEALEGMEVLLAEIVNSRDISLLEWFIRECLVHHQKNTVWDWFHNKEFGTTLQDMLKPLYFATARLLNNGTGKEVLLTLPPELTETVDEVYQYIIDRKEFYYSKGK
jgi:TPR repeat protein/nucleoside-triphosphatase THEP1